MGTFLHTFTYTHPVETVTAWHMRKGALTRAIPPWSGSVESDKGVEEGVQAKLKMAIPGSKGLANRAWTALITDVHDSGFSDIMLEGPLSTWKHTHKCREIGRASCRERV